MKEFLASDHAGFEVKEKVKKMLEDQGHEVEDCGAFEFNPNDDYPDFIKVAAIKVAQNLDSFGIVFGKSGAGEAMAANKIKGIRAFLAINEKNVVLARQHNDANVMSIGSELIAEGDIFKLVQLFLETPFSGEERHVRRIEKIKEIEEVSL
ncbi:MAG: ribose-5-phosphate isomerase [Candidatus Levybacteria bacterium CG_4_10_14_0_2_um_filter_36_16]|nr:MAG: ribose-5-phosphate isomerase [Candidatus Levybacteria bacterium CG2_30_37_29]PIZ97351.1 MAG: ribose-5-phosphate isomerase [Candidatus Levybacteria bacterium CG_4_10_14_0_2_um_filter_36_16]